MKLEECCILKVCKVCFDHQIRQILSTDQSENGVLWIDWQSYPEHSIVISDHSRLDWLVAKITMESCFQITQHTTEQSIEQ